MKELKPGFIRFDEQIVDHLQFLADNRDRLNKYEKCLIADRIGAFREYKFAAVVTKKQHKVITRLAKGIKLLMTEQSPEEKLQGLNLIREAREH